MSVAKKLNTLDKLLAPPQFGTPDQLYVYDEVRRVLPQIVAVVEAAESYREEFALRGVQTAESGQAWRDLQVALAALDEALGEDVT